MKHDETAKSGHTLQLVRETADGLGQLVSQHIKLARLELLADLKTMGSRAARIAVMALLMVVGYALTLVGVAVLISGNRSLAFPLLGIGVAHLVGAGLGMRVVLAKMGQTQMMKMSTDELGQTAGALMAAAQPPEITAPGAKAETAR